MPFSLRIALTYFGISALLLGPVCGDVYQYDTTGALVRAFGEDGKSTTFSLDAGMNISGASTGNPLPVAPGGQVLVSAAGVPRANPASTGIGATADLSAFGGSASAVLNDVGADGDIVAGDGVFSALVSVPSGTSLGTRFVEITFTDSEGRTWQETVAVDVAEEVIELPDGTQDIPTLPEWAMIFLAAFLVLLAARKLPQRSVGVVLVGAALLSGARAQSYPMWEVVDLEMPATAEALDGAEVLDPAQIALPQAVGRQAASALSVPASIDAEVAALATALGDARAVGGEGPEAKALRIFTWVRNNIDYEHYEGLRKGSALTLLEGAGNDYDTCGLLRDLLVAAGYPASSVKLHVATHAIDYTELSSWLGLSATPYPGKTYAQVYNESPSVFFGSGVNVTDDVAKKVRFGLDFLFSRGSGIAGGYPVYDDTVFPDTARLAFSRMTVALFFGTAGFLLDPSFKEYEKVTASADLASLAGYVRQPLLDTAGGVDNNLAAHSLNEANIGAFLTNWNGQMLGHLQGGLSGVSLAQLVNGRQIRAEEVTNLYQASPPGLVFGNGATLDDSFDAPGLAARKSTVNFLYGAMNYTLPTAELKGRKVTLTFSGNTAELRLDDGSPVATATVAGATMDLKITMSHPGRVGARDITMTCKKGDGFSYALVYAFTASGRLIQKRYEQLKTYRDAGLADSSREVRSETLNIMGLTWMYQTELCNRVLAAKNNVLLLHHHRLGRMAQEEGFYVDVALQLASVTLDDATVATAGTPRFDNVFHLGSLFASAMEHGIIEQMQPGSSAISTVNILRKANATANPVFLVTQANWPQVSAQLSGYSTNQISEFGSFMNTPGARMSLPKSFGVTQGSWVGSGWIQRNHSQAGMIINGGYSGGYSTTKTPVISTPVYIQQAVSPAKIYTAPSQPVKTYVPPPPAAPKNYGSDPVDMATGAFIYASEDMVTGLEGAPRGLGFSRNYSSNAATVDEQNVGYGWTHSLHIRAAKRSALEEALALGSPKFATALLTAIVVASDLYRADATPREWVTATLAVAWFVDRMKDNAVFVRIGKDLFQFLGQPDGTFTPPPGSTMTLTKAGDGTYRLKQRLGNTIEFDASGKATKIVDVDAREMTFHYHTTGTNAGLLDYVQDHIGRRFTLGYDANKRITSVTDSTTPARNVSFAYDSQGNLTSATDPEAKITFFDYEVSGAPGGTVAGEHRIVRLRNHDGETITQNVYDGLGRVERQFLHGDQGKTFRLYYSGRDNFEVNPQGGATHYFYDERGRATGQRDAEGNTTSVSYDGQDRVISRRSATGEVTGYAWDAANNLTRIDHPRGGGSTVMAYDGLHRLDLLTDANGVQTDYVYFGSGSDAGKDRPQSVVAAKGTAGQSTTTYAYVASGAAVGRLASVTDGDGLATTKTYDANGQPDVMTAPGGFVTNENYSARGNLDSVVDPNGRTTAYTYNKRRQATGEVADAGGIAAATDSTFDNQARIASMTPPADNTARPQVVRTYSPTDQVKLEKLAGVTVSETVYDTRDWAVSVKDAANRTTTFARKENGNLIENRRPASRTTKFAYDGDNRVTQSLNPGANSGQRLEGFVYDTTAGGKPRTVKTEADGRTVTSEYDSLGRLRFVRDRKGATFEFRYDALGRRTHVITPLNQQTVTEYKKNGRVAKLTEPGGDTATFSYNATSGRLASVAYSGAGGGTVNYTGYDANGNVTALDENGANGITRTYDGLNRVTSYTFGGNTIGYRYYPSGKLAKLIYPGGTENGTGHVAYTYDANGRLYQVIDKLDSTSSPRTTTHSWNPDGRLAAITRPNGTTRTISYDTAGRPISITESAGLAWNIGYYPSDDIRTLTVTPPIAPAQLAALPGATMTFDSANQLATFNGQGVTHDLDGNMTHGPVPASGTMGTYTYDSRNRLTSVGGLTYSYNAENNRVAIGGTETTSLVVDPEGALPKVLARTKNGTTTRYVYGAGLQYEVSSTGAATYYHYDQTGNTAALSNSTGALTDRIAYSPYGTVRHRTGTTDTPFLFGGFFGVMTDTNGLINMRARYYNPLTMRFVNSDPARDGLNWYAYANGNPINFADPTGFGATKVVAAINSGLNSLGFVAQSALHVVPGQAAWRNSVASAQAGNYGQAAAHFGIMAAEMVVTAYTAGAGGGVASTSRAASMTVTAARVEQSVVSGSGTRVFWSGEGARKAAEAYALQTGGQTLEMTVQGKILDAVTTKQTYPILKPIWDKASVGFARGADGSVEVFHSSHGVRLNSVWSTKEYPRLIQQGSQINYHIVP